MEILDRLIKILCDERGERIPSLKPEQKADFFRALCNIRPPMPASTEFLALQNNYLTERKTKRGIINVNDFVYTNGISLFKGDITAVNADVIVNAANSRMLGCFHPLHNCIDNAIHSAAGVQVRLDCYEIMQGREAENGKVIVTKAYNLPSTYIFHTVGPIVYGSVTGQNREDLKNCYSNCLRKAEEMKLNSIAFCCISTGVFGYPQEEAAELAVKTVKEYLNENSRKLKIIFNVFTEKDYEIYGRILG
ncbi:MAG: protein-ADP-ribose hydrolase [Clostridia bacterium]|nr:protein-ADP-ribose hydrolase [Clostridia bacterium]